LSFFIFLIFFKKLVTCQVDIVSRDKGNVMWQ